MLNAKACSVGAITPVVAAEGAWRRSGAGTQSNSNQHVKQSFDQCEAAAARPQQSLCTVSLRAGLALPPRADVLPLDF